MLTEDYNEKELLRRLHMQKWTYAKTQPWLPHFYVWINQWTSQEDFEYCVNAITHVGKWEFYMKKPRHYFYDDMWRYWWMNGRDGTPIVINRQRPHTIKQKPMPKEFL